MLRCYGNAAPGTVLKWAVVNLGNAAGSGATSMGDFNKMLLFALSKARLSFAATLLVALAMSAAQAQASTKSDTPTSSVITETLTDALEHPWALAFLPDGGSMLITERPGRLRLWSPQTGLSAPLTGVPAVYASGQGGLLDVAVSPDFARDRLVYLAYAENAAENAGTAHRSGTAVGRGRLADDGRGLEGFTRIFQQQPKLSTGHHYGARLAFDREGYLFIALGENNQRATAQDLDKLQGKLVRLRADGSVPVDNPFAGARSDARPEIWSYGHRNPQGLAVNPWTGALWLHEHGPRGGDEINLPQPGKNYGWPLATHGINYSGLRIPESRGATYPGTEPPHHYWPKSPAISGMAFYDHARFPAWQGSLFIGALADRALIRLTLQGNAVVAEERLLENLRVRIRDVRAGTDGYLYVLTDEARGQLLRVSLRP